MTREKLWKTINKMPNHKVKKLIYKGEEVEIDEKISKLMINLWKLGIGTTNCCQGHCAPGCKHTYEEIKYKDGSTLHKKKLTRQCHKYIWIVFERARDADLLFNYIAEYDEGDSSMYTKMHGRYRYGKSGTSNWIMKVYPDNLGERLVEKSIKSKEADSLPIGTEYKILETVGCGKNKFSMMVQLYIPLAHLKYVEKRIALALREKK